MACSLLEIRAELFGRSRKQADCRGWQSGSASGRLTRGFRRLRSGAAMQPKLELGKVTTTPEALFALTAAGQDADFFLQKHASGDWGICDPATQERALRERSVVFSRYRTLWGKEIVVRTCLATEATSLYCDCILDSVAINHGFTYDTGPVPKQAAPINPELAFKYDSLHQDCGPLDAVGNYHGFT